MPSVRVYLWWTTHNCLPEVRTASFAHRLSSGVWPFTRSHSHIRATPEDAYSIWGLSKPSPLTLLGKILKKYLSPHLQWDLIEVHLLPLSILASSLLSTGVDLASSLINLLYTNQHLRVNSLENPPWESIVCFVLFCSTWITPPLESFRGR